jgi:hypothetical protein
LPPYAAGSITSLPTASGAWPPAAASPQEQTAAVLARLTPSERMAGLRRSRRAAVTAEILGTGEATAARRRTPPKRKARELAKQHLRRTLDEYTRHYNVDVRTGRSIFSRHDPTVHPLIRSTSGSNAGPSSEG